MDYKYKYTPENITSLDKNEVFVFGSNLAGIHGAGAAKLAHTNFGAIYGKGNGIQGQSYAIPTKDFAIETLEYTNIEKYTQDFITFARENPKKTFLVTLIGCGLAGYNPRDIAPLFNSVPLNVILPKEFANETYNERFVNENQI
jgi:hypothetical protein